MFQRSPVKNPGLAFLEGHGESRDDRTRLTNVEIGRMKGERMPCI